MGILLVPNCSKREIGQAHEVGEGIRVSIPQEPIQTAQEVPTVKPWGPIVNTNPLELGKGSCCFGGWFQGQVKKPFTVAPVKFFLSQK